MTSSALADAQRPSLPGGGPSGPDPGEDRSHQLVTIAEGSSLVHQCNRIESGSDDLEGYDGSKTGCGHSGLHDQPGTCPRLTHRHFTIPVRLLCRRHIWLSAGR